MHAWQALQGWLDEVRGKCAEDVAIVLLGNKADAPPAERMVPFAVANQWASAPGQRHYRPSKTFAFYVAR